MGDFWGERRPPGGVWGGEVGDQGIVVVWSLLMSKIGICLSCFVDGSPHSRWEWFLIFFLRS